MNTKAFFVAALSSAFDLGLATGDDLLRHVTPEVLAAHLPRPLWARLLTACVGAPRVDAQLLIETVGVPNLCEHVPGPLLWLCLADIGARALGGAAAASPPVMTRPQPAAPAPAPAAALLAPAPAAALLAPAPAAALLAPVAPAPAPLAVGPAIPTPAAPLADLVAELDAEDRALPPPTRTRTPTSQQRFRASNTGVGRTAQTASGPIVQPRRPQAAAVVEAGTARARRPATEVNDYDIETDVRVGDDWRAPSKAAVDVDDEQLVDWSASEETVAGGESGERKR